jgi:hypothetical protein
MRRVDGMVAFAVVLLAVFSAVLVEAGSKKRAVPVRFSHASHRDVACVHCHDSARKPVDDTYDMKSCYRCHQNESRHLTACRVCHEVIADGRPGVLESGQTLLPPNWLKGPTHDARWANRHARIAGSDSPFCGNCHQNRFCVECHAGATRSRSIHPGDWMGMHGVQAGMNTPRCTSCHRTQTFCITCHRRSGAAPDAPIARRTRRTSVHGQQTPAQICQRARRNITACASCHSEASCVTCHARISPHPAGWRRRCGALAASNPGACAKCHPGSPQERCR